MAYVKTPVVARICGIGYNNIIKMIQDGRMTPPEKDTSGHYIWTEADMDRLRTAAKSDMRGKTRGVAHAS